MYFGALVQTGGGGGGAGWAKVGMGYAQDLQAGGFLSKNLTKLGGGGGGGGGLLSHPVTRAHKRNGC